MKKLIAIFFFAIYTVTVAFTGVAFAENCSGWEYYDSNLETCVACANSGFTITTTELPENISFWFSMSAMGNFAVDWDDGTIDNIERDNTTAEEYSHTYTTGGVKNIKFCGKATGYNPAVGDNVVAAISFYNSSDVDGSQTRIATVTGSLGNVFPTLGTTANQQPRFRSTFQGANSLSSIPVTLFDGVSGAADGMFRSTFDRCAALKTVPYGLFANASGGAPNMFRSTFYNCTGLNTLPGDLFAGITEAKTNEFMYTFFGTVGLKTYIPSTTFTGLINKSTPPPTASGIWNQTFASSGLLTKCPSRTHDFITGYESSWGSKVSCEPDNTCTGANYWDSSANECRPCPTGYNYDKSDTKSSIEQCAIRCPAGKYLANKNDSTCSNVGAGYYADASTVYYGLTGNRTQCPHEMPTLNNTVNAASESQCVVYCPGTGYRDTQTNTCIECPTGYDFDKSDTKTAITDCKIHCDDGTYLPTARAPSCSNVGDGFYATSVTLSYGETSGRSQCPDGQLTGTLTASSSEQCIELCQGATYRDSESGECTPCPIGYNAHVVSGKTSANDCQIHCVAGTYIKNIGDTVCSNVGDGFYASASNVNYGSTGATNRQQCPNGQMTGTQTATDSSQCQTSCTGSEYYDSGKDRCENCPVGYTDNQTNGKNSINQCQLYCAAGNFAETYTPILYLQSNGTKQFIDTGYEITGSHVNGTVVVGTTKTLSGTSSDSGNFFGNLYGSAGFSSNYKKGDFGLWVSTGENKGDKAKLNAEFTKDIPYTIIYDIVVADGSSTATLTANGNSTPPFNLTGGKIREQDKSNSFKLFTNGAASRNGNTVISNNYGDKLFAGRIYSLQLYEDDVLVLDLIPVRRESDGALGVFNKITKEFYGNSGLNDFTAGADNGASFMACAPVGNGYYVGANYTNFGSPGTRNRCPGGASTIQNGEIINDATTIYQCDGVEPCLGAQYPDMNTGVCTDCPQGYGANVQDGKESISECQIRCVGGTYLANAYDATCTNAGNGYYAAEETVNWGDFGMRTRCSNGGPTNTETASDETECQEVAACTGATYMKLGVCAPCPTGYTANQNSGKSSAEECQMICPEGTFLETANDTTCTDAGVGYWATGGAVNYGSTSRRTQCATGLTTVGYGHGADELADCGHKLHINDKILYTKTAKSTAHTINIQPTGDSIYYLSVSDTDHDLSPVHVTQGNLQYTAFDDSILYGERDFETNTRITQ